MRRLELVGALVAVTALVLTSACRGGDSPDHVDQPDGPRVGTAKESDHPDDAVERLANVITQVMGSGRYRQTVTIPGLEEPYYQVTGEYDIAGRRFTADMAFWNSEVGATRTIEHTFVDARGFQQAEGWHGRAAGCWLVFDPAGRNAAARQTDVTSVKAPGAVLALHDARGRTSSPTDKNVIEGTVGLRTALSLMLPGFIRQQGTPPDGRVPASFTLEDGLLSTWTVLGRDVVPTLTGAGTGLKNTFAEGLGSFTLEVAYDRLGEPVTVQQPPEPLWMSSREMRADRGCQGD